MFWLLFLLEGWGFESFSGRDIFCLKNFDTLVKSIAMSSPFYTWNKYEEMSTVDYICLQITDDNKTTTHNKPV